MFRKSAIGDTTKEFADMYASDRALALKFFEDYPDASAKIEGLKELILQLKLGAEPDETPAGNQRMGFNVLLGLWGCPDEYIADVYVNMLDRRRRTEHNYGYRALIAQPTSGRDAEIADLVTYEGIIAHGKTSYEFGFSGSFKPNKFGVPGPSFTGSANTPLEKARKVYWTPEGPRIDQATYGQTIYAPLTVISSHISTVSHPEHVVLMSDVAVGDDIDVLKAKVMANLE